MPTTFPDSTTIPAKGFLMLFPSGKPSLGIQHLDFQLGGSGESITISQEVYGNYTIIDAIEYPSQTINISYGRVRDGQLPWIFFEQPTPRASNDGSNSAGHSLVDQSFVSLYPNPSQGAINIQFYTYEPMEVEIQLYSGTGQLLQVQGAGKQHITGDGSIITLNLNPDYYHPGVYIVGILMKNELLTKRIFLTH